MTTEVIDISQTRKEIKIEIPVETVKSTLDAVAGKYARSVSVPGFRKGHAPTSVVRTRYRTEIQREVIQELVPVALGDAVDEAGFQVIGEPDLHLDELLASEQFGSVPLKAHAHIEVLADINLGNYKGLEVERTVRPVEEKDIDSVIDNIRESAAALIPVEDRPSELGDTVTVNFDGTFVETPDAEHVKVDDVDIELGSSNVQDEFNENLVGKNADDETTFTVIYPADFSSKSLAGKTISYQTKVTAIRRKELPELDDEFARSLSEEHESVAQLRQHIRESLEERVNHESDERLRRAALDKLVAAHQFEVPTTLTEHERTRLIQSLLMDLQQHGVDPRQMNIDWANMRQEMTTRAENSIRASLLMEEIADAENLDVSEEEMEAEIASVGERSGRSIDQVRAALTKDGGESSIAVRLRNQKALNLVVENAKVTLGEWHEPEAPASAEIAADGEASTTGDDLAATAESGE